MITEDYVSFEVAKLLKEKGFKEWCRCCYGVAVLHNGEDISFDEECELKDEGRENEIEYVDGGTFYYYNCKNDEEDTNVWAVPTLQMTMKWLREVHYYNIEIDTLGMMELNTLSWRSAVYYLVNENECYCEDGFDSYEEAAEAAIKYCLENLV